MLQVLAGESLVERRLRTQRKERGWEGVAAPGALKGSSDGLCLHTTWAGQRDPDWEGSWILKVTKGGRGTGKSWRSLQAAILWSYILNLLRSRQGC